MGFINEKIPILSKIGAKIYKNYLKSTISKILFSAMIVAVILSIINNLSPLVIIFKIILYIILCGQINCMIYGNCKKSAFLLFLVPIIGITIQILDIAGFFNETKKRLKSVQNIIGGDTPCDLSFLLNMDNEDLEDYIDKEIEETKEEIEEKTGNIEKEIKKTTKEII